MLPRPLYDLVLSTSGSTCTGFGLGAWVLILTSTLPILVKSYNSPAAPITTNFTGPTPQRSGLRLLLHLRQDYVAPTKEIPRNNTLAVARRFGYALLYLRIRNPFISVIRGLRTRTTLT